MHTSYGQHHTQKQTKQISHRDTNK
ncbi:hypothetical protein [Odoribacter splanchnicus]